MKFQFLLLLSLWLNSKSIRASTIAKIPQCTAATTFADLLQQMQPGYNFDAEDSLLTVSGMTTYSPKNNQFEIQSSLNISRVTAPNCPSLQYAAATYSPTELITSLTAPCRYDRLQRPPPALINGSDVVQIYTRAFVYGMQPVENSDSQFNMQILLQFRYVDRRLAFSDYAPPKRFQSIQGGSRIHGLIWLPHLFLANVLDSSVFNTFKEDVITSIAADGTVFLALSIEFKLRCSMKLKNFPFDEQLCTTTIESWQYDSSELVLFWEPVSPLGLSGDFHLPGYTLQNSWHNASVVNTLDNGMWHGLNARNYSSISFTLQFLHDANYYLMDYFIPSIIIVAASWVSFWLRADQTPARTILGCHTMLQLITLSANQLKNVTGFDTVFKAWFLGCVLFIFGCLVEFAFSNTIWRRKRNIELKRISSKSILESTVVPRRIHRRSIYEGFEKVDSISCLTHSPVVMKHCVRFDTEGITEAEPSFSVGSLETLGCKCDENVCEGGEKKRTFATMTPEEVSIWLDRKARIVFPLAFVVFNLIFWIFVLII